MVQGLSIHPVPTSDLHRWWEDVSKDLDECRVHDKENVWLEDIYHTLKSGAATLYVALDGDKYEGMFVATQQVDRWDPENRWIHVWYCHGRHLGTDVFKYGVDYLDRLARSIGAKMVTFQADRPAFERWGRPLGFEVSGIELCRRVE